ncbi:hypothetical protein KSS87_009635 [Heliosperma pusillum]|nr:hypothetical protein KSS87_009635 [Heliosperma pusillum]
MARLQSSINVIVGVACRNFYGIKLCSQTNPRRRWCQCVASARLVSVASWGRPWCRQPGGAMEGGREGDGVHGEEAWLQVQSGVRSDDGGGAVGVGETASGVWSDGGQCR